jgi:hypothetical protein
MGEIRSTLDIIMEKTKGLTMTAEEREALRKNEEIKAMEGDRQGMAVASLKEECKHLDPDGDPSPYLKIMETILKLDTGPIKKVLSGYHKEMKQQRRSWEARALERLHRKAISGTALVPNLRSDPAWLEMVSKEKAAFQEKLSTVIE